MKVAVISDVHSNLRSRLAEARRVLGAIPDDLRTRGVDLIALPGDIAEEAYTPEEEDWTARWLRELGSIAPVVGVTGNHDVSCPTIPRLRLPCSETHAPRCPITIVDRPRVVEARGAAIACLPWPRAGHLLAATAGAGPEERYRAGVAALRAVLLGLRQELEQHDGPRILVAHAHVRGARLGAHTPDRADFNLGVEELASVGADFVALGHLHEFQHWIARVDGREVPVVYPGSPFANTWGEIERKGYVIADFEPWRGGLRGWEFAPTIAQPLAHKEVQWDAEGFFRVGGQQLHEEHFVGVAGRAVRLRCKVAADQRDAAARAAEQERERLLAAGAVAVEIELDVIPTVRARVPEIASQPTIADQLDTWLRGQSVEDERRERLRGMVTSLEVPR